MFTGIVTEVGVVKGVRRTGRGLRLTIRSSYRGLAIGESIAVDGACLTVIEKGKGAFAVEAVASTRGRTKVAKYRNGTRVNLERAMALGDRLGGHLVAGHVDGVGKVVARAEDEDMLLLDIAVPAEVRRASVAHGSITVDGVSLTINRLGSGRSNRVQVALIPHTREHTTLGDVERGDPVHLEADIVGKFVMQLLGPYRARKRRRES